MSRRILNNGHSYQKNKQEQYDLLIRKVGRFCCDNNIKKNKTTIYQFWNELSGDLNRLGPPIRNISGWKKVWSDVRRSPIRRRDLEMVIKKLQQEENSMDVQNDDTNNSEIDLISIPDTISRNSFDTEFRESDSEDNNNNSNNYNYIEVKAEEPRLESEIEDYSNNFITYITSEDWVNEEQNKVEHHNKETENFKRFLYSTQESIPTNHQYGEQSRQDNSEIEEYSTKYIIDIINRDREPGQCHNEPSTKNPSTFTNNPSNDEVASTKGIQESLSGNNKKQPRPSCSKVAEEHTNILQQTLHSIKNQMEIQTKMLENMSNMALLMERQTVAIEKQTEAIRRQAVATEHHTLVMNSFVDMIKDRMPKLNNNNLSRNTNTTKHK